MKQVRILASVILLGFTGYGVAQNSDTMNHAQHHSAPTTDKRIAVEFPPAMREHILTNMRDHLLAISQIQEAIGKANYDKAAQIAEGRLGMTALKTHGAYENSKYMPQGMKDIGTTLHKSASQFAIEIQNTSATGDVKPAMLALSKTTNACVACHASYKLK